MILEFNQVLKAGGVWGFPIKNLSIEPVLDIGNHQSVIFQLISILSSNTQFKWVERFCDSKKLHPSDS